MLKRKSTTVTATAQKQNAKQFWFIRSVYYSYLILYCYTLNVSIGKIHKSQLIYLIYISLFFHNNYHEADQG